MGLAGHNIPNTKSNVNPSISANNQHINKNNAMSTVAALHQLSHGTQTQASQSAGKPLLPSDPARPPRLSRRERSYYCFYLDISTQGQHLQASLSRYIASYGARQSAFLDINVTHIITDKPMNVVTLSSMVKKFGCKVINLYEFIQKIADSYARMDRPLVRPPMSPTLRKAIAEKHDSHDLSHFLAQEKRRGTVTTGAASHRSVTRGITPLYNAGTTTAGLPSTHFQAALQQYRANEPASAATNANVTITGLSAQDVLKKEQSLEPKLIGVVGDKKVIYEPFKHPFLLLEEITHTFSPVYKEYAPSNNGQVCTFPMLNLKAQEFHCPWLNRHHGPSKDGSPHLVLASSRPVLTAHHKHRAANTVRTLAQHRVATQNAIAMRPKVALKALGRAPVPAMGGHAVSKQADRIRPGFCECCYEKYSNLDKHVSGESHRRLVSNAEFYRSVDRVIYTVTRPLAKEPLLPFLPPANNTFNVAPDRSPVSQSADSAPISPVKSAQPPLRVKSIPLRNITNRIPLPVPAPKPLQTHAALDLVEIGSDSPIYSSPSLKRRRSQRLVGRGRLPTNFIL